MSLVTHIGILVTVFSGELEPTLGMKSVTHTHTHPFNGPFSRTTRVSRYQKGKPIWILLKQRDSEWQWYQLGHMQACISLQTGNHASTPLKSVTQRRKQKQNFISLKRGNYRYQTLPWMCNLLPLITTTKNVAHLEEYLGNLWLLAAAWHPSK